MIEVLDEMAAILMINGSGVGRGERGEAFGDPIAANRDRPSEAEKRHHAEHRQQPRQGSGFVPAPCAARSREPWRA